MRRRIVIVSREVLLMDFEHAFDEWRRDLMTPVERIERVFNWVLEELHRAEMKFPGWPEDVVHAAAIVGEESGELIEAALDAYYGRGDIETVRKEAIQTAAMSVRLLIHLEAEAEEEVTDGQ